ncbi:MAG: fructosamine kinase family protein, partial [Cyanobacteria bacterium J06648_11]
MSVWSALAGEISTATGEPFEVTRQRSVGGGSINAAYRVDGRVAGRDRVYFVKLGNLAAFEMYAAEAEGLQAMHHTQTMRVPTPICWGTFDSTAYVVMDFIELSRGGVGSAEKLGQQLAAMHRHASDRFGWHRNNTIGSTPQRNEPSQNWVEFYRDRRLDFQLRLARRNGYSGSWMQDAEKLGDRLHVFFTSYQPEASLLHGDLWSGNYGFDESGQPVIFDPATYYGDREADIAMTELFGGFPAE